MRTGLTSIDWGGTTTSPTRIIAKEDEVANDERGKWIVKQLQEREEEFTVKEDIRFVSLSSSGWRCVHRSSLQNILWNF